MSLVDEFGQWRDNKKQSVQSDIGWRASSPNPNFNTRTSAWAFVKDAAGALWDYAVGGLQGGREVMRTEQEVNQMRETEGSHTNPSWSGGDLKPEYTPNDLEFARTQQDTALTAYTEETLTPSAMIVGGVLAPNVAIPAMIGSQAVSGYKNTEGDVGDKAYGAFRQATYGPLVDIMSDPEQEQKFEENPARMTANTAMALGQVVYPVERIINLKLGKTKPIEQQTPTTPADEFGQWQTAKESTQKVYDNVKTQMIESGASEAEANAMAQIYANHAEVFGKEYNMRPDEYHETRNFKVEPADTAEATDIIEIGEKQLGKPYKLGADGFDATDCGKFTQDVFAEKGVPLEKRTADGQYWQMEQEGKTFTDANQLQEGDLVFWDVPSNRARWEPSNDPNAVNVDNQAYQGITHVGIYDGKGRVLQAGSKGVDYIDLETYPVVAYGRPLEGAEEGLARVLRDRTEPLEEGRVLEKQRTLDEIEKELADRVNEEIEPVTPAVGGSLKFIRKTPVEEEVPAVKFDTPETEARWQEASKGVQPESIINRIEENITSFKNKATRVYEDLPNGPEFAQLKFDLQNLEKGKGIAKDRTGRILQSIVNPLNKQGLDLFTRKVILDDLARTEGELPFGFTKETLATEKAKVDEVITSSPKAAKAIETRRQVWEAIKNDYTKAMKEAGADVSERVSREDYFRHQVLEYANLRAVTGTGTRLRTPTKRGFLKGREGSAKDINANYLQAEFEVMAQMIYDTELARFVKRIDETQNIRDQLKQFGKEWRNNIPEGYTTWQPREGSSFYMAKTIPEKLATQVLEGIMEEIGIGADQIGQVLAKGSPFKEFVVKEEVAKTLNKVSDPPSDSVIGKISRKLVTPWKKWQLQAPTRFVKYELRNITGDLDAVVTMNPRAFKRVPQAMKELYQVIYGDRAMTPEMREWFKRGGMESTLAINELPDINRLTTFEKFANKDYNVFRKAWEGYWSKAQRADTFREGILRYSNYLEYLDQMQKNNGKPRNFGASRADEVMALSDIRDRAYKLSNDVMGAYDNVSVLGKDIRAHLIPFWSWVETNFSRYRQFFKNQVIDKQLAEAVGRKIIGTVAIRSPYYAYRTGMFFITAGKMWAMLQAYNYLMFGEEENELPIEVQTRPHIVLGRDEKGNVRYFSRLGSFSDFLEWFGLDSVVKDVKDYLNGDRTVAEIAQDSAKNPLNKLVQGVTPLVKTPAELIMGKQLFPDMFKRRSIRDNGQYLADSFGLGNEFRAASRTPLAQGLGINPRPGKPYLNTDTGENLLYYKAEPNRAAYYGIIEKKREFLKEIGQGGDGDFSSPRTNVLRNYKLALREKDADTAAFYLAEYKRLGGTKQGLKRSLEAMDPMSGLSAKNKKKFKETLNGEDLKELEKATKYYKTVLLGKE